MRAGRGRHGFQNFSQPICFCLTDRRKRSRRVAGPMSQGRVLTTFSWSGTGSLVCRTTACRNSFEKTSRKESRRLDSVLIRDADHVVLHFLLPGSLGSTGRRSPEAAHTIIANVENIAQAGVHPARQRQTGWGLPLTRERGQILISWCLLCKYWAVIRSLDRDTHQVLVRKGATSIT